MHTKRVSKLLWQARLFGMATQGMAMQAGTGNPEAPHLAVAGRLPKCRSAKSRYLSQS